MIIKQFDLDDVFLMSEIIDKMGLEIESDNIIKKTKLAKIENLKDASQLGKDVVLSISIDLITGFIKNIHKAKNEVKELIGNLTGMSKEEVSKMSPRQIRDFFTELVKREEFGDFLNQAGE